MQKFRSATFTNAAMGFNEKLTVGSLFRTFRVEAIIKIDDGDDVSEIPRELLRYGIGSRIVRVSDKGGCEFEIMNNQDLGLTYCFNDALGAITTVPGELTLLSRPETVAEFHEPLRD